VQHGPRRGLRADPLTGHRSWKVARFQPYDRPMRASIFVLLLAACSDPTGSPPDTHDAPADHGVDGTVADGSVADDGPARETAAADLAPGDTSPTIEGLGALDGNPPDLLQADAAPDAAPLDASTPDLAPPDASNPTGLPVPCKQGPGWTLFRFHYGGGGTSPGIDVWDASCSYSYAPNSACNVYAVYPGFGSVSYTSQGYPILTTSEYLRVRFSVSGLSFTKAAVYIQARSYATASSTYYRIWSPLYGDKTGGPVDNDWIYDWYGLDWSGYLTPADPPSLTAIQIYAGQGSGQLAVKAVELCVQ